MDPSARVLSEPGSLSARKALLAAWKSAGDPRAELLEKQLELRELRCAGKHSSKRTNDLDKETNVLEKKHGRAWAGELADLVKDFAFHRGLVAEVSVSSDQFLKNGARLFALAPIQHVNIVAPLGSLEALLSSPLLRRVETLDLSRHGSAFGDAGAIAVASTHAVAHVRWLSLSRNEIGDAGVEALAASPYLDKVAFLSLSSNPADPTPSTNSDDLGGFIALRPPLADRLAATFGERPWLTADDPDNWPPDRDELVVTA